MLCEPVATTRSASRISTAVDSLVIAPGSIWTRSRGASMRSNCAWMNSSSFAQVLRPLGLGATTIALRAFSAFRILLAGVAAGLVDGVIAATTPTGRAISTTPRSGYSAITSTVFIPCRSRSRPSVLR